MAAAAEEIQEVLGDLNDSVVTRALLRELAADSAGRPGNALLTAGCTPRRSGTPRRALAQFDAAWHEVQRRAMRRWLRP